MTTVTFHGKKRIKERMGISMKGSERQARLALERGLHHRDTSGRLHKWISGCSARMSNGNGGKYVVFNNQLFVYDADYAAVITVLDIPTNLHNVVSSQMRRAKEAVVALGV